ncbi:hypothetical protein WMY93_011340 [Mugilogobius chulae]|uniref:Uncharacterized protein n=1 Tax=Mugilogobius chulae TaxID=88201 RepID=A0AAW0PB90_9GOBI
MRVEAIQRKLLTEDNLTFAKACEVALSMEMASKNRLEFSTRVKGQATKVMDQILQGLEHVTCFLVTGKTREEHLRNLEEVLSRLESYGVRVKRGKCTFMQEKTYTSASDTLAFKGGTSTLYFQIQFTP